jgi:acetyl esterase/lipase
MHVCEDTFPWSGSLPAPEHGGADPIGLCSWQLAMPSFHCQRWPWRSLQQLTSRVTTPASSATRISTDKRMLTQWADWYCEPAQRRNPLVSPLWADLRDLHPIYIQAGRAEILYDSIQAFVDRAQNQGADVVLETWEDNES